jgi:hypothetical protein
VRVDLERRRDARVPELLLRDLHQHAQIVKKRRVDVAELRTIVAGDCSTRCSDVDISLDRWSGESCLPGVPRLNEMWRNASGVFMALARRGHSAEWARETRPLAARLCPTGDPGAGRSTRFIGKLERAPLALRRIQGFGSSDAAG